MFCKLTVAYAIAALLLYFFRRLVPGSWEVWLGRRSEQEGGAFGGWLTMFLLLSGGAALWFYVEKCTA